MFRTTWWGNWRCDGCGSVLGISDWRRILPVVFFLAALFLATRVVRIPSNWEPPFAAIALFVVFVVHFRFCGQARVIERRGFRCLGCGYDLRGQVQGRCPECGDEFNLAELQAHLSQDSEAPVNRRRSRIGVLILLVVVLAMTLGLTIMTWLGVMRVPAGGPATTTTQASAQPAVAPGQSGPEPASGL